MIPLNRLNKLKPETARAYIAKKGRASVYIFSEEHGAYWRSNRRGYVYDHREAGIYILAEAYEATSHCGPEKKIVYINVGGI